MTVRTILARPVAADTGVLPGLAVYDDKGEIKVAEESTQPDTLGLVPLGIAMTDAAGGVADVVAEGEVNGLAGAAIPAGSAIVAQVDTGRLIPLDGALIGTLTEGSVIWLVGRALEAATGDGSQFRAFVRPIPFTVPTAPSGG